MQRETYYLINSILFHVYLVIVTTIIIFLLFNFSVCIVLWLRWCAILDELREVLVERFAFAIDKLMGFWLTMISVVLFSAVFLTSLIVNGQLLLFHAEEFSDADKLQLQN